MFLFTSRPLPAPDIPGNTSKPKGAPRKYQSGPSSWSPWRVPGREGDSWESGQTGVGIIAVWFAAGMWIYSRARFLEHDNRHTLVTELAESGAGDEVIMSIAGHVSRAMLSRYSHVRMEAKRRALDEMRRGSGRSTRGARRRQSGGSRARWLLNQCWSSDPPIEAPPAPRLSTAPQT